MTEIQIKEAVRDRDGHKCVDCGMTDSEHNEKYGKSLDVHRLIPSAEYDMPYCVTLCRKCHGSKPKKAVDLFYESSEDVKLFWFNLYLKEEKTLFDALCKIAELTNQRWEKVIEDALRKHIKEFGLDDYAVLNFTI